ncbi:MAG: GNAT family N-acetyltransferase [Panacibacter sp.]
MSDAITIRPMHLDDLDCALQLSTSEGWNQSPDDWKLFINNPVNICIVVEINKKIIGTTTAINYSGKVAWISMVLVDKAYRGIGVSKLLLQNILEKTWHCKSVKLDATQAGQHVYKTLGFKEEYFITRMTCLSLSPLPLNDDVFIEAIHTNHIQEIAAFDQQVFGANRVQLIEYLIKKNTANSWMIKRNNKVDGFVLGRDGNKYHHIGPVIASSLNGAKLLLVKALHQIQHQPVVVDVLNDKEELINWLASIGFIEQRQFIRMYKGGNFYPGIIAQQYLICGPEFG